MVLKTTSMSGEVSRPGTEQGAPEGYEFVKDEEGRMAIKKLVKNAVEKVAKTEEVKVKVKKKFTRSKK